MSRAQTIIWRGIWHAGMALVVGLGISAPSARAGEETIEPGDRSPSRVKIRLEVDATDLARNIVHASLLIPARPGALDLHYVLWSPGNHAPSGPIQNLIDLKVSDCKGRQLEWRRDPAQVTRFSIVTPEGCETIRVDLAYIASQPGRTSGSTDTYGRPSFGGLNWNTVLLYPEGFSHQEIDVEAALAIPAGWQIATSLSRAAATEPTTTRWREAPGAEWVDFKPVPLAELVDSPVILGEHLRSYRLDVEGVSPHWMHLVADDPSHVELPDWLLAKFEEMVRQAIAIFASPGAQTFPRDQYHFLWLLGEDLNFGVEHAMCTFMGDEADIILTAEESPTKGGGGEVGVVAHEYFHAWCAKLRAPAGLVRPDYHTPLVTDLLWVYEGLTTYYTNILSVRSGLITFHEYLDRIRDSLVTYQQRSGRLWRAVVDTARAAGPLRGKGLYWSNRRQGQEYYGQGALFWLEADALIRSGTDGERSLDDFCQLLFDVPALPVGAQATFTRQDIVDALAQIYEEVDWDALIRARLERPQTSLDLSPLARVLGYQLAFTDEPTTAQRKALAKAKSTDLSTSIGINVDEDHLITDMIPGSPGDQAKLAFGMEILAVDGRSFTHEHLRQAVATPAKSGLISLTVKFGQKVETIEILYDGGSRFPRLVRDEARADLLNAISRAREFAPARH